MKDYKKAEQALQLLEESDVTYTVAYETEKETITNAIHGQGDDILACINCIAENLAGNMARSGAPRFLVDMVFVGAVRKAIADAYKENGND